MHPYMENILNPILELSSLPLEKFIEKKEEYDESMEKNLGLKLHFIYNYIGKTLNQYSAPAIGDYIGKIHDTNNIIRMVQLQLEIKQERLDKIESILKEPKNKKALGQTLPKAIK